MQLTRDKLLNNKISNKQEDQTAKKRRRIITSVILITSILISGILWFRNKNSEWFEGFQEPLVYKVNKDSSKKQTSSSAFKNKDDVLQSINLLTSELRGEYGIYYFNLLKETEFGINEDSIFTAASVNKVPIIVAFYQGVERGEAKEEG